MTVVAVDYLLLDVLSTMLVFFAQPVAEAADSAHSLRAGKTAAIS